MYFLMCFLVRVFRTITGKINTEYLTPGYYRPVTGVKARRLCHSRAPSVFSSSQVVCLPPCRRNIPSDMRLIERFSEVVKIFAMTLKQLVLSWWWNSIGERAILGLNRWLTPSLLCIQGSAFPVSTAKVGMYSYSNVIPIMHGPDKDIGLGPAVQSDGPYI